MPVGVYHFDAGTGCDHGMTDESRDSQGQPERGADDGRPDALLSAFVCLPEVFPVPYGAQGGEGGHKQNQKQPLSPFETDVEHLAVIYHDGQRQSADGHEAPREGG